MGGRASQPAESPAENNKGDADVSFDPEAATPLQPQAGISRIASSIGSIVPTIFTWGFGGHTVYVTGAWDSWSEKVLLTRNGTEHVAVLSLPVGSYQFKFVVDGNWRHNPALSTETDQHGNLNNIVVVSPHYPEYDSNEPLGGVGGPPSPVESYDFSMPAHEDYAVEPVALPSLFKVAPLEPSHSVSGSPNPSLYVALNHLFHIDPEECPVSTKTVASINRYKTNKFVTTVMVLNNFTHPTRSSSASTSQSEQQLSEMSVVPEDTASARVQVANGAKTVRELAVAGVDS